MAVDRRSFLKAGAVGVGIAGLGAGCGHWGGGARREEGEESRFRHGVASGDPLDDRVILWTRVSPRATELAANVRTRWWVATDAGGRDVVRSGDILARADRDHTVKVDADGLSPGSTYYYGFFVGEGDSIDSSPIGRTRTLPGDDVRGVRLAFASCANYPQGFFNGYANMAGRDDIDIVLHLGDYLYEYANGEYGDGTALGRVPVPDREIVSLDDYRLRHANYKSDPDLQAAHARHPWITVWDDHESANNSHLRGAQNHTPGKEGEWRARRLAAIRAYYEWMPIRELRTGLFRSFRFGELLDLIMLDTRLHGRDPVGKRDVVHASDPDRTLLGDDQTDWLMEALSRSSRSGSAWRVIGQQVIVSPVSFDGVDFNPDAWDGYRANRDRMLTHIETENIEDVVFLTGDVHSTWVFDVPSSAASESDTPYDPETGAGAIAVEFVTPAISSPPIGSNPDVTARMAEIGTYTPHLRHHELTRQGYAILDITRDRIRTEYIYTAPVDRRSAEAEKASTFECRAGRHHVVRVDS